MSGTITASLASEIMTMNRYKALIPNALCVLRLLLTPILLVFALQGQERAFLYWGYLIILTDVLDGPLARAWGVTSAKGTRLDGRADMIFYAAFFGLALYLTADETLRHWGLLSLPLLLFGLLLFAAQFLTGRVRWLHLWSKRAISYLFIPWISLSILDQFNVKLLIAMDLLALVVFTEEVAIYVLARDKTDERITSILDVRRYLAEAA